MRRLRATPDPDTGSRFTQPFTWFAVGLQAHAFGDHLLVGRFGWALFYFALGLALAWLAWPRS